MNGMSQKLKMIGLRRNRRRARILRPSVFILSTLVALALALLRPPARAEAHPLGNFTVNQFSRLVIEQNLIRVRYIVDMAEIPTFQERQTMDSDRDGQISADESAAYLAKQSRTLLAGLELMVNGAPTDLRLAGPDVSVPPGQGGLPLMRMTFDLAVALDRPVQPIKIDYRVNNFAERIGWREIVMQGGAGVTLRDASVPAQDQSNELRSYPQDMLSSPLNVRAAQASATFGMGSSRPAVSTALQPANARVPDAFANLIATQELTLPVTAFALLLALLLGAGHALTPGHGKTIVAAYLVGTRGTARHAIFLGLTTTITHTAGVFALGIVTLWISNYILPEQLYPWLQFISGALVVGIGLMLFRSRLAGLLRGMTTEHVHDHDHTHDHHDHEHDHDHAHDHDHGPHGHSHLPPGSDGQPVTWRSLLAMGISGGLLPCPSALVVLLSAIALHRVAFGILLIVAFSIGLAGVLSGFGLLLIYMRRLFERFPTDGRLLRALPVVSAAVVTVAGLVIAVGALMQTGLLRV